MTKGTRVILKVTKDGKGSVEFEKPSYCESQSLAVLHIGQILRKGRLNWPEPAWLDVGGQRDVVEIQHSEGSPGVLVLKQGSIVQNMGVEGSQSKVV